MANRMTRPVQLGFMSPQRANQLLLQGFPQPTATAARIPQYTTPSGAVPPMALSPSQLSAARSQQRAAAGPIMPLEQAAMRGASIPPGPRLAPPAPRPMQTIGDAFRQPLTSPTGQGLAAAALTGLEYGGPSMTPTSLGQGLARMGAAGLQAFTQAEQARVTREAAEAEAERKRRSDEALAEYRTTQLDLRRKEITAAERTAGIKGGRETVRLERDLRKDYETRAKPFSDTRQFFSDVVNFSGEDNSAAEDLALVFSYMKLLDPGSVVREGEQYQVRSLGNIPDTFKVILSQYGFVQDDSGEMQKMLLPQPVRNDIRAAASEKYADLITNQHGLEQEYVAIGERGNLDKNYFTPKLKQTGDIRNPIYATTLAEAEAVPQGSYVVYNGKMYRQN